jgi:hypothetical protein
LGDPQGAVPLGTMRDLEGASRTLWRTWSISFASVQGVLVGLCSVASVSGQDILLICWRGYSFTLIKKVCNLEV